MWAVLTVLAVWVIIAMIVASLSSPGIGCAVFFAPLAYFITYQISNNNQLSWIIGLGLIVLVAISNEIDANFAEKENLKAENERKLIDEKRRIDSLKKAEIANAAFYVSQMDDEEAAELYSDYQKYYLSGEMLDDVKSNFENRLIAKAKPMREAEELCLAEEEAREAEEEARRRAIEHEEFEKEQRRLNARYGTDTITQSGD